MTLDSLKYDERSFDGVSVTDPHLSDSYNATECDKTHDQCLTWLEAAPQEICSH